MKTCPTNIITIIQVLTRYSKPVEIDMRVRMRMRMRVRMRMRKRMRKRMRMWISEVQ